LIRNYLNLIGKKRLKNNQIRFTSLSEVFGAIKEIKLKGFGEIFVKHFADSAYIFAKTQATYKVINVLPRFLVEIVSFGGILLILLYIMFQKGTFIDALPIITLYVFAAYRLMPALQQIYSSITQLTFIGPSVDSLYNDFNNLKSLNANQEDQNILSFNENITLKNVNFNYPETSKGSLIDVNLSIPSRSTVGLIGTTGSGKTTAIDIILGLLEPQNGTLEVDGHIITQQNLRSWQNSIGYVPQHIYLMDNSVAANIAFGIDPKEIDQKAVEKAAKIANLHDFVTNELPKQYQTTIGENGSRLSGGQRQRIGIARALYHNPQVLILDEATSALDNETEKLVMDAIYKLNKKITVILVAHRLNTLKNCDIVFKMDQGKIIDQGNFDKLINNNSF
ncbi:ABC transporter ATP-binding protein/permease, partial [Candidatus Pelagibacter ubique]|nr:ABC transporter ATP-binding protein/permease [Candidatus Pelagibacter ubique]